MYILLMQDLNITWSVMLICGITAEKADYIETLPPCWGWRLEVCGLPILMINATCDPAGNNIGSHKLFLFLWPAAGETQELKWYHLNILHLSGPRPGLAAPIAHISARNEAARYFKSTNPCHKEMLCQNPDKRQYCSILEAISIC